MGKKGKEYILSLIKRRMKYHENEFDRYSKECEEINKMNYISKRNKRQHDYSYSWMTRHLEVLDELRLILIKVETFA